MREILFRGKRKDNGDWVEGFYYFRRGKYAGDERFIYEAPKITTGIAETRGAYGETTRDIEYTVIPETVGQYTGLTDKNGKKIFEGDIVIAPIYYDVGCYPHTESKIISVKIPEIYKMEFDGNFEIIGNIHDNPELLKGGAEL